MHSGWSLALILMKQRVNTAALNSFLLVASADDFCKHLDPDESDGLILSF